MGTKTELKAVLHENSRRLRRPVSLCSRFDRPGAAMPPSGALHLIADTAGGRQR